MASMDVVIQSLAGTADQTEMNSWALSGLHEIINVLPDNSLEDYAAESDLDDGTPTLTAINLKKVFTVTREESDSGPYITCRKVDLNTFNKGGDNNSIYKATVGSPMYNVNKNILSILPIPTADQTAKVTHFSYPTEVDVSEISEQAGILSLTPDITQLVILFTAIKVLHNKMNEKSSGLQGAISRLNPIVFSNMTQSLPSFSTPSKFISPVAPSSVDIDFSGVGTVETFTPPTFVAPALAVIGPLSFSQAPLAPIMNSNSLAALGTAPSYTAPSVNLSFMTIDTMRLTHPIPVPPTINIANSIGSLGTAPSYVSPVLSLDTKPVISDLTISTSAPIAPVIAASTVNTTGLVNPLLVSPRIEPPNWADVNTWINTEEDSEMSGARVQSIGAQVQEYSARLNEAQLQFNKENEILQKDLTIAIKNVDLENSNQSLELQKYSTELQEYQANINKEVQVYQQNLQKEMSLWETNNNTKIAEYQGNIQNELNVFNSF